MKYFISESKLKNVIFKYLDSQDFIQIDKGKRIYFVNSEGDEYAQIRFDYDIPWVGMSDNLCKEVSSFFSISKEDSQKIIGLWIKHKFKIGGVVVVQSYLKSEVPILKVPY